MMTNTNCLECDCDCLTPPSYVATSHPSCSVPAWSKITEVRSKQDEMTITCIGLALEQVVERLYRSDYQHPVLNLTRNRIETNTNESRSDCDYLIDCLTN
jgi:hypothetical protein